MRRHTGFTVLLGCLLLGGCAWQNNTPHPGAGSRILDNHGGLSHPGRRIVLRMDGTYVETKYSDVVGDASRRWGTYSFDSSQTRLSIQCDCGEHDVLNRVDYKGVHYWVQDKEMVRITNPAETLFRQVSLRSDSP